MKTIGTKLDNKDYEKFLEKCNNDGMCVSEELRDLIRMSLDVYEEDKEMEKEQNNKKSIPELKVISIDGVPVKSKIVGIEP